MDEEQMRMAEELLFTGKEKPSFGKMLHFGIFDGGRVFPYPKVSAREKEKADALLVRLKAFAEEHIDGAKIDQEKRIPDKVITGLAEMGILGMTVPEEFGGLGMTQDSYCRAMEVIASYCGSTALWVNVHQSIGLKSLLLFGTEEQQKKWLPPLAKGEITAAFSLTEPNAGSDAAGVETYAEYDAERDVYVINGRKQWTTNGGIADVLTLMAKTKVQTDRGEEEKITAFLVQPTMPGFKVLNKALEKVGMRGTWTANLAFENMEVPAANILGPKGGGLRVALTVLDFGRTTFGATCTGSAKYLLERAIRHGKERKQFKRPLASFTMVKEKIARMSALVYAMDAALYLTAGQVDRDLEDIMLESAMLKVFASDAQWQILYDTMQILGGRSFFTDQPFERMMRDARLNMIGEGSNEVMRAFIGAVGLRDVGMQLKKVADASKNPMKEMGTMWKFGKFMLGKVVKAPVIPVQSPLIQSEAKLLGKAVRRFGLAIPKLLGTYREQIVEHQLELNRIANCAMALFTVSATLSKLDGDLTEAKGEASALGQDVAIAKLYCKMAFETIDKNLAELGRNNDGEIDQLSDQITTLASYSA